MSKDSNFRVTAGSEKSSEESGHKDDVLLGLELIKRFQLLNRASKLKVIQVVNDLASSAYSDEK